jgi:DNA-binding response OmpR family regulator
MPAESPTILIIDDEPSLLLLLDTALRRAGFTVRVAKDGAEGERLAIAQPPDLIISDIMMPPPDGLELRRRLSANAATESIPFVFLTARANSAEKRRALEGGISDYITKPFDREELVARIKAILRREDWQRQAPRNSGGAPDER